MTGFPVFQVFFSWGGVRLTMSPLGTSATIWPIVPAPDDECGAVGWNENWQGKPKW
jgi:hypothetical protein